MNKPVVILLFIFFHYASYTQTLPDTTAGKIYSLGEVLVSAKVDRSSVTSADIRKFNSKDVSNSVRILPSVILSSFGSRIESTVYLRGFDIRSVPVFIDGIPVYVPYDGYVDLARFTTYDISRIDVSKGFTSMMYGANTIGGAINLVTIKPSHRTEIESRLGFMSGKGYESQVSLGRKLDKMYLQTGISLLKKQFTPLSHSFETSQSETDHRRDNSSNLDTRVSFKAGYTPHNNDEYSISYLYSHGSKDNPVYLGDDTNTRVRYWKWPYWDKQSVYYISRTDIGEKSVIKARIYFDRFKNKLSSFDDATYSTQERRSSFNSFYLDNTYGGNLEFSTDVNVRNHLMLSLHGKNDNHYEHNDNEPVRHFADNTFTAGIEDVYQAGRKLSLVSGLSFNSRIGLKAEDFNATNNSIEEYPENNSHFLNAQIAAGYILSGSVDINFNIAYKSRFATMKDRYSYRLGTGIPNPGLEPEDAINTELASSIQIGKKVILRPELFLSRLYNTIQLVSNVSEDLDQMQNTGSSLFSGFDISIDYRPFSFMKFYVAHSFIRRKNLSNPEIRFTGVPQNKLFASVEVSLKEKLIADLFSEYSSGSFTASDGTRFSPEYFILCTRISSHISGHLAAEAGINNIFDRNYSVEEGYPEAGRNFFIALTFTLEK